MTDPEFNLKNPPIIEAVLDIDCDLPPGQQFENLEKDARDRFRDSYPKFRKQFVHEHQVQAKTEGISNVSVRQDVQAFQFLQEDEKQLVQVRRQGFSFNKLEPYTRLSDYFPEIQRTWNLYAEMTSPVEIRVIRLRYINRIMLPFQGGKTELDEYFQIGPRLPDEDRLSFAGFLCQQSMVEKETGNQVNLVLTAQLPMGQCLPIILDLSVNSVEPGEPDNWTWISQKIHVLRQLKNQIFVRTVTEKCLNLFQPS